MRNLPPNLDAHFQNIIGRATSPRLVRQCAEPLFHLLDRRSHPSTIDLAKVHRVLIVRADEIGDLILTTPLLRELRRNLPQAHITLIVKPAVYPLVEHCPHINELLAFDHVTSSSNSPWQYAQPSRHTRALALAAAKLWPHHFDLVLVPRWEIDYSHASFLAYFSGAPWRVGYSRHVSPTKFLHHDNLDSLFSHLLHDATPKHEVLHNLHLLRFLGCTIQSTHLESYLTPQDHLFAQSTLTHWHPPFPQNPPSTQLTQLTPSPLLALSLGAGLPKRIWPPERFAQVAQWLIDTHHARLLLLGSPAELPLAHTFFTHLRTPDRVLNLVGQTTLRQSAALLAHATLFLGNDTGPTHLAASVGTPCVQISCHPLAADPMHYNSPVRFHPWSVPHRVLQPASPTPPCAANCAAPHPHCILSITPTQVQSALTSLLPQLPPLNPKS